MTSRDGRTSRSLEVDDRSNNNNCLSNAFDRLYNHFGFCPCVYMYVHRSVVERLRPQFFTDFHEILHAVLKFQNRFQNRVPGEPFYEYCVVNALYNLCIIRVFICE